MAMLNEWPNPSVTPIALCIRPHEASGPSAESVPELLAAYRQAPKIAPADRYLRRGLLPDPG